MEPTILCTNCGGPESDEMVECSRCLGWEHLNCAKLSELEARDRVKYFYCLKCREKYELVIEWRIRTDLSHQERVDKVENYYEVEKILNHKICGTKRQFKIKWEGYPDSDNSWVQEENLDGCLNLLQDYCIGKNLATSTIIGRLGAARSRDAAIKTNKKNWVTLEEILEQVEKWRNLNQLRTSLKVCVFDSPEKQDAIFLLNHDFHCYVILYLHQEKIGFIRWHELFHQSTSH